jgi:hypothetical protein
METNKITWQSRSDDSGPHNMYKGHSNPRSNQSIQTPTTGQNRSKADERSNERHKYSSGNIKDAASHSGEARSGKAGIRGGISGTNSRGGKSLHQEMTHFKNALDYMH